MTTQEYQDHVRRIAEHYGMGDVWAQQQIALSRSIREAFLEARNSRPRVCCGGVMHMVDPTKDYCA